MAVLPELCFAPLIMAMYGTSIQTSWHHAKDISGPYVEIQTCRDGLGAHLKASDDWVTFGVQYGLTLDLTDDLNITIQPQGGGSYSNTIHPTSGIRQITKFEAGLAIMLTYGTHYVISLEYTHQSNGRGIDPTNAGQDLYGVGIGYIFGR